MIVRSYDPETLRNAMESFKENTHIDARAWLANKHNVMLVQGDDVGIALFEYPGVYTVHWFYVSRGRKALQTAKDMVRYMFDHGAKALRGITPAELKNARWLAKQIGFQSMGIMEFVGGPNEVMIITKKDLKN